MGKTIFKVTEEMKQQIIDLYNQGLMDTEIAKTVGGITDGAVYYWRHKLGLKSKFDYSKVSKIDNDKFEKFFNQGLSDYAIAKELNMSPDGIFSHRMRHGYTRESLVVAKARPLTEFQKEVLIGTLLGDSSLAREKEKWNTQLKCSHGIAQKEYCSYKTKIFESIGAQLRHYKRNIPDKRNGICYDEYVMHIPANPELNSWYEAFYPKGKKVIPVTLFNYFTAASLAFMFMDDGSKVSCSYNIASNCFGLEELKVFCKMLKEKLNLDTTIQKDNKIYIKACSRSHFEKLINPYLCDSMKYKLQVSRNSVNLGKPL